MSLPTLPEQPTGARVVLGSWGCVVAPNQLVIMGGAGARNRVVGLFDMAWTCVACVAVKWGREFR